jgi:hypothetical protein
MVISLLLLLLTAVWFPAAILVARTRAARTQWSKEKMLQALAANELAESDALTLTELLAESESLTLTELLALAPTTSDSPTRPLEAVAADDGDVSPDAPNDVPTDVADAMPAETPSDADAETLD